MTWRDNHPNKDPLPCERADAPQFALKSISERSGQTERTVWALFHGNQRIHEVHALTNLKIVQSDAKDYIRAARMAV